MSPPVWHGKGALNRLFASEACIDGLDLCFEGFHPLLKGLLDLGAGLEGAGLHQPVHLGAGARRWLEVEVPDDLAGVRLEEADDGKRTR